jgi:hypothetical protein
MKNKRYIPMSDKLSLRSVALRSGSPTMKAQQDKRSVIETVNDQLKNISYLVHSRHRSLHNFMLNLITALIAYTHRWAGDPPSNLKNRV